MSVTPPPGTRLLTDVVREAGVSYRQADFWIRSGYVTTLTTTRDGNTDVLTLAENVTGPGYARVLNAEQGRTLMLMGRLTRAGFSPALASDVARRMAVEGYVELGEGLAIADVGA